MDQREIKFRAWDKEEKVLVNNVQNDYVSNREWGCSFSDLINGSERFILTQFTGLKDKNGKEIYEGDIVRVKHRDNEIGVVTWDKHGSWIFNKRDIGTKFKLNITSADEVIGNIYENKELIK